MNPARVPQLTQQQLAYIALVLPLAQRESKRTGIPPEVFIIQSGVETGWGTSGWFRNNNNPAGIGVTGAAGAGFTFPTLQAGFDAYADKLMGKGEAGQEQFVADVKAGATSRQLLRDLEASPWAAGHYHGTGLEEVADAVLGPGNQGGKAGKPSGGWQDWIAGKIAGGVQGAAGAAGTVVPGISGVIDAVEAPAKLAGLFVGVFSNWRFVLELLAGGVMMLAGFYLIARDMGATQAVSSGAKTAAVAAAA